MHGNQLILLALGKRRLIDNLNYYQIKIIEFNLFSRLNSKFLKDIKRGGNTMEKNTDKKAKYGNLNSKGNSTVGSGHIYCGSCVVVMSQPSYVD